MKLTLKSVQATAQAIFPLADIRKVNPLISDSVFDKEGHTNQKWGVENKSRRFASFVLPFLRILTWTVALMSGVLSLARELLGIYAPQITTSANLFWTCTRIAFIVSAMALIISQRREISSLRSTRRKPAFRAADLGLSTGLISRRLSADPLGTVAYSLSADKSVIGTVVFINGIILNHGEVASSLYDWEISVLMDGDLAVGHIPFSTGNDVIMQINKNQKATYRREDRWCDKALTPIDAGGSLGGWIAALFLGLERDALYNKRASIVLSFRDVVTGERHEIIKEFIRSGDMDDPDNLVNLTM